MYGASNNSDAPLGKTADGGCSVIGYYRCATNTHLNNYTYQLIDETIIYSFFLNECLHAQVSFCKILNLKTNPNVTVCEYNRKKC